MEVTRVSSMCTRDQLMVVATVWRVMALMSLGGKEVAVSLGSTLGPGLLGRAFSVHMSSPEVLAKR